MKMSSTNGSEANQVNFEDNIDIGQIANSDSGSSNSSKKSSASSGLYQELREDEDIKPHQDQPQQSKQDIMRRKLDLLTTLHSYKARGHMVQNMTISTPLNDLEFEVHRVKKLANVKNNVEVYKKMLISGVGGAELINNYSPKKLALSGWSRNFAANTIHECEPYLHQIAEEEGQLMDPRWMLMVVVIGSGVTYHFSQSFAAALGNSLGNSLGEDIMAKLSENPEVLKNMMGGGKKAPGPSFDIDVASVLSDSSSDSDSDFDGEVAGPSTPAPVRAKRKYVRKVKPVGNAITV